MEAFTAVRVKSYNFKLKTASRADPSDCVF